MSCEIAIPVGAVIGRERYAAAYQVQRGEPFAATDRSHKGSQPSVGAVIGRE
jgi:hypothetical protein